MISIFCNEILTPTICTYHHIPFWVPWDRWVLHINHNKLVLCLPCYSSQHKNLSTKSIQHINYLPCSVDLNIWQAFWDLGWWVAKDLFKIVFKVTVLLKRHWGRSQRTFLLFKVRNVEPVQNRKNRLQLRPLGTGSGPNREKSLKLQG